MCMVVYWSSKLLYHWNIGFSLHFADNNAFIFSFIFLSWPFGQCNLSAASVLVHVEVLWWLQSKDWVTALSSTSCIFLFFFSFIALHSSFFLSTSSIFVANLHISTMNLQIEWKAKLCCIHYSRFKLALMSEKDLSKTLANYSPRALDWSEWSGNCL